MKKKNLAIVLTVCLMVLSIAAVAVAGKPGGGGGTPTTDYIVIAQPEGGMKCMIKKDYSQFAIMPPGYNMRAQVFKRNADGTSPVVTTGITVKYSIDNNTYAQGQTPAKTNFWTFAPDFGWNLAMDTGTKGYKLAGDMVLDATGKGFEALKIPQVPFLDGDVTNRVPYQRGRVKVYDTATGALLAETTTTMPSSTEMRCDICHGGNMDAVTDQDILADHDRLHGTTLATDGKANLCSECHADPSVGKPGIAGIPYLSTAMHTAHSTRMSPSPYQKPVCYTCHPGPTDKCYRGEMNGKSCDNVSCHVSMAAVGSTTRTPWKDLPKCANCHQAKYAENTGKLFKDSFLANSPSTNMNNQMYCQTCHGAQHAEYTSSLAIDNEQPVRLQGNSEQIGKGACGSCHKTNPTGYVHR